LDLGVHPRWRRAEVRLSEPLLAEFMARERDLEANPYQARERRAKGRVSRALMGFLRVRIEQEQRRIQALRRGQAEFTARYARAPTQADREQAVLDYAGALGADRGQILGDRLALARWFGADAVNDRYQRRLCRAERLIVFGLQRLGRIAAETLRTDGSTAGFRALWRRLDVEGTVYPLLSYEGDARVVLEAFRCLVAALKALPQEDQEGAVGVNALQYIYRSALETRRNVWIQCEALALLQSLAPANLRMALERRLREPHAGDDLFVRRRAVLLLGVNLVRIPELRELVAVVAKDPSPFVRQGLVQALGNAPGDLMSIWLPRLAREDPVPQVRAAALLEIPGSIERTDLLPIFQALLVRCLMEEGDGYVCRVGLTVVTRAHAALQAFSADLARTWREALWPVLDYLRREAPALPIRRYAAEAKERLWCDGDARATGLHDALRAFVVGIAPGRTRRLPRRLARDWDPELFGRVLSVIAQNDFGFDVRSGLTGIYITRGHVFDFRWWRLLHELRHPSPDKRQAFPHTIGRLFRGDLRAPSAILAELAATKVPGEPLFMGSEGGWRPYLPLVDDCLSGLGGRPVRFYTGEGVTDLTPPRSFRARVRAYLTLSHRFPHYARLRNWQEDSSFAPYSYLAELEGLGFRFCYRPHTGPDGQALEDPSVRRFFPVVLPFADLQVRLQDYFFSVYGNSLAELALFTFAALLYFVVRHLRSNRRMGEIRARLPLVLGGWGTRGKSGTERLKAAMINALGYSLVSKTTGCEAMFLYADTHGKMHEMFLFRPYDKATIWEQMDVMSHAVGLGGEVFLWECMALTPSYVRVLQRHWVQDDLSTITNTFPDHEDIQGPAGIDIPEVMTQFIPEGASLVTSEEQMLPILKHAARTLGTEVMSVGWLEAGLLTPDVLKRFPYDEHPYNIALVLRLGQELGIEPDFALKEIADRVVPDLGVLKIFPASPVRARRLEFVNGMSANERYGCLSNWVRMAFDTQDPEREPGVWISTVVNNRADRIARSRVFAGVIVQDIAADRHFLIGGNLSGFKGYINESWEAYSRDLTLWPETAGEARTLPQEVLLRAARRLRVAVSIEQVQARLKAMLEGIGHEQGIEAMVALGEEPERLEEALRVAGLEAHGDGILRAHRRNLAEFQTYRTLVERVAQAPAKDPAIDEEFRGLLKGWFQDRIVVIDDYYASGDQIISRICDETPPGYRNRIMGIQNIKGTGLDFVYRWYAWGACHDACAQIKSARPAEAERGLAALVRFQEYGLLCEEQVRATVEEVRHKPFLQREHLQAQFSVVLSNLEAAMAEVHASLSRVRETGGLRAKLIAGIEAMLDAGDAVRRRKKADRIYEDLIAERIGIARAILELQGLTKRQKGGWLAEQLQEARVALAGDGRGEAAALDQR
jgi:poly-gamma-glutamate synthase PgsB/CapB